MNDMAKNLMLWVVVAVVLMVVFQSFTPRGTPATQEVLYSQFIEDVRRDRIERVEIAEDERSVAFERSDGSEGTTVAPRRDERMMDDLINHGVEIKQEPPSSGPSLLYILLNFAPWILFIGIWIYFMRQMQGGGGGRGAMSFGKSRAKLLSEDQIKITFADVAGCRRGQGGGQRSWSSSCAIPASSRSWAARSRAAC
jgi:cell division protease FtsH